MYITTNLFAGIKLGKGVKRNVHMNEARREGNKMKKNMRSD